MKEILEQWLSTGGWEQKLEKHHEKHDADVFCLAEICQRSANVYVHFFVWKLYLKRGKKKTN